MLPYYFQAALSLPSVAAIETLVSSFLHTIQINTTRCILPVWFYIMWIVIYKMQIPRGGGVMINRIRIDVHKPQIHISNNEVPRKENTTGKSAILKVDNFLLVSSTVKYYTVSPRASCFVRKCIWRPGSYKKGNNWKGIWPNVGFLYNRRLIARPERNNGLVSSGLRPLVTHCSGANYCS